MKRILADGVTWTLAGSQYFSAKWSYIGLAVTSHNDGTLSTAEFDNLRLLTPAPSPTNFRVVRRGADGAIELGWDYSMSDVDRFLIRTNPQRAGNHEWTEAATVPGSARQAIIRVGNLSGVDVEISAYRDLVRSPTARTWATPTLTPSLAVAAVSNSSITLRVSQSYGNFYGDSGPWSLERSADGVNFAEIASGLMATDSANLIVSVDYSDSALPVGATRHYRARYRAPNGDISSYSAVVSATTTPTGSAPLAPTSLRLAGDAGSQMKLVWQDNATNEGSYEVERATDGTNFSLLATLATDAEEYIDASVATSTAYSYRVRAVNGAGPSGYSNTLTLTSAPAVPAAPSNLAASSVSATHVSLTWTDNSPQSTASFDLQRSADGVNFERTSWVSSGPPFTNATDTTVSAATTYYYGVGAVNVSGSSAFSNVVRVTTPAGTPPAAPSGLTATALSSNQIRLAWTDNATNETGFEVQRSTDGVNFSAANSGYPVSATAMTDFEVRPSTTYHYRVRAVNTFGASTYSNIAQATTLAAEGPWQSADIGAVAQTGSDNASGSIVTVNASGADIWHEADSFRFRYQTLNGDGAITARVTGISNTDGWAKAGVMIRGSLLPGARNVFVAVTPTWHGLIAQVRGSDGASTTGVAGPAANAPYWVRLSRAGATFTAQASHDGSTWSTITTFTVAMDSSALVGLAVTSHNQNTLCSATFDNVTISTSATPPPSNNPPPTATWSAGDIGTVGMAGSHTASGNTITINGSGADIWGAADAFHFVWQGRSGDGVVEAQVTSMGNTNGWAKAGVMIRESSAPNGPNVFVAVTPSWHGIVAQARSVAGGETPVSAGPVANAPYWIRLARSGNTFTASTSPNGVTWTAFATFDVAMSSTANFGFAVTSHDNAQLNQANFADPFIGVR